ncbi:hypothetical protein [Streptomyces antibioticus]|uniref:Uncharacterized protein n=1 Tax=Streptomyces antibioticus TaxID=1890 RepID=A0AAE6Y8U1_STRAT|nr:hypothetical protein [Streptomyces antibioticus]QIT45423.1 hypothetical protein HCX60_19320 [Streptomyces antibioticus]
MPTDPYAILRALLRAEAARSAAPKPSATTAERGGPKPTRADDRNR